MSCLALIYYMKRNFKLISIVGFVTILQSTWECTLLANYFGLLNGGPGGVIWCTIAVWYESQHAKLGEFPALTACRRLLMLCVIASM